MGRPKKYQTEEERKAAIRERKKRYYQENLEEEKERMKRYRQENAEKLKEHKKRYYQENREKEIERHKRWKKENPDYQKRWIEENHEKVKEYQKSYYQENREEILEQKKEYYNTPIGRAINLVKNYKQNDKNANRGKCTLTAQWIVDNIFNKPCHYNCGETDWKKIGCDRINNDLPHTPDNVVPCCGECNKKRGTMNYEKFIQMTISPEGQAVGPSNG